MIVFVYTCFINHINSESTIACNYTKRMYIFRMSYLSNLIKSSWTYLLNLRLDGRKFNWFKKKTQVSIQTLIQVTWGKCTRTLLFLLTKNRICDNTLIQVVYPRVFDEMIWLQSRLLFKLHLWVYISLKFNFNFT